MEFTFGIITTIYSCNFLNIILDSIISQNIEKYEIIIVGNNNLNLKAPIYKDVPIKQINFDESVKRAWITRKKNIICQEAKYENIVLMHDYIKLENGWYEGFKKYGNDFKFCVNQIKRIDGTRFRDYVFFPVGIEHIVGNTALVPYDVEIKQPLNKLLYISGGYYIIKKNVALENPLCEKLGWGEGEDGKLSKELTSKGINITCNPYSIVKLLKHKHKPGWENEMSYEVCNKLLNLDNDSIEKYVNIQK